MQIWDTERLNRIFQIENETGSYLTFETTKDDKLLVAVNTEGFVDFVDLNLGKTVYQWVLPYPLIMGQFKPLALSSDKLWIACGSSSGEICLIDHRTGILLAFWKAHEMGITKVVTSRMFSQSLVENVF